LGRGCGEADDDGSSRGTPGSGKGFRSGVEAIETVSAKSIRMYAKSEFTKALVPFVSETGLIDEMHTVVLANV
jgi:hypothetical protein